MPYGTIDSYFRAKRGNIGTLRGRMAARKSSSAARAASIAKARKTNRPVKRARRRMARAPLKFKNAKSIGVLARQVVKLQQMHWGDLQYQRQTCQMVSTGPASSTGPVTSSPVLFAVNNFFNLAPWYQGRVAGGQAGFGLVQAPGGGGATVIWNKTNNATPALDDEYNWMRMTNTDNPSYVQYMPVIAYHKFKVRVPVLLYTGPIRFKFQFIKTKKMPADSRYIKYGLPDRLGAYHSLIATDLTARRALSKKYHKVLQTKYITISNSDIGSAPGLQTSITTGKTTIIEKDVTMTYQFTNRDLVRCDFLRTDSATDWANNFKDAIDHDEIVWCLISSNLEKWESAELVAAAGTSPPVYAPPFELECSRYIKWRDNDGVWGGGPA